MLTVNEKIVIISTANNDEHSPVREELFERLSEGHTETQPLGDNRVKQDTLTEQEASPSFKLVKLPIYLKNEELAGTVGNHFHGDMVLER